MRASVIARRDGTRWAQRAVGVGHAWLVDADTRTLQVYRRVTDGWLLALSAGGDDVVRAAPFDAIELELGLLWRW